MSRRCCYTGFCERGPVGWGGLHSHPSVPWALVSRSLDGMSRCSRKACCVDVRTKPSRGLGWGRGAQPPGPGGALPEVTERGGLPLPAPVPVPCQLHACVLTSVTTALLAPLLGELSRSQEVRMCMRDTSNRTLSWKGLSKQLWEQLRGTQCPSSLKEKGG